MCKSSVTLLNLYNQAKTKNLAPVVASLIRWWPKHTRGIKKELLGHFEKPMFPFLEDATHLTLIVCYFLPSGSIIRPEGSREDKHNRCCLKEKHHVIANLRLNEHSASAPVPHFALSAQVLIKLISDSSGGESFQALSHFPFQLSR